MSDSERSGVVLVVDDHEALARSLVSLLGASGFEAWAVHTGAEALAFVRTQAAVSLILLDMSMPDMSGVEVLRALRMPGGSPHLPPVVMFSADDDPATHEELTQLGVVSFVSKTNPGGLLHVVAAHVRPAKPRPA